MRFSCSLKQFGYIDFSGFMSLLGSLVRRIDQTVFKSCSAFYGTTPLRFSGVLKQFGDIDFSGFMPLFRS